jgi:hypothetical protein
MLKMHDVVNILDINAVVILVNNVNSFRENEKNHES